MNLAISMVQLLQALLI